MHSGSMKKKKKKKRRRNEDVGQNGDTQASGEREKMGNGIMCEKQKKGKLLLAVRRCAESKQGIL